MMQVFRVGGRAWVGLGEMICVGGSACSYVQWGWAGQGRSLYAYSTMRVMKCVMIWDFSLVWCPIGVVPVGLGFRFGSSVRSAYLGLDQIHQSQLLSASSPLDYGFLFCSGAVVRDWGGLAENGRADSCGLVSCLGLS